MAYDDGAAGKVLQSLLKSAERIDVDIVGGLVQQEHVALLLEREGQLQPVALTAREHLAQLALVGAGEVEAGQVTAGVDVAAAEAHGLIALRYNVVY